VRSPAVMPPRAGHSVNPEEEELKTVVSSAVVVELAKDREDEIRNNRNRPVTTLLRLHYDPEELKAMSSGEKDAAYLKLVRTGNDITTGAEPEARGALKASKPKTQADRNKLARRKYNEMNESEEKKQKKLDKSIGEVGRHYKEIKEHEVVKSNENAYNAGVKKAEEAEIRSGKMTKTPRVGANKFVEAPIEVVPDAANRKTVREAAKVSAIRTVADSFYRRNMLEAPPLNSRANARRVQKRVRKANMKDRHIAAEYRDKSLLL